MKILGPEHHSIDMGGLSTPENASRRLSKPRTNTSSSNLLSTFSDNQTESTSSPLNSPDTDYFGNHAAVVSSQGERRSRRKSRSKIRAYLYGANDEAIHVSSEEDDSRNGLAGTARSVKNRLSRTGSSIMQLQSAKASTAYLSKSDSQGSDPEESAMIAVQIKEKAHNDSLAAQNHVSSPVDENRHVDSVMAPVRRKSLYTPGIATRNPSDILRKPPPPDSLQSQIDRDYYYNPARPETSPLSHLAALNLSEDGRATPASINYPQLGGLELGTLRVTNGMSRSDTPDLLACSPTPGSKTQEGYFTASEGSVSGNVSTPFSPATLSSFQMQMELREILQPNSGVVASREPSVIRKHPDSAAHLAHEYMAELDGSPFSYSKTSDSKQWEKRNHSPSDEGIVMPEVEGCAVDQWRQLIDDAGSMSSGSRTNEDAFRRLNCNAQSCSDTARLSVPSSITSQYSASTEIPKTDSGYSSNSSLTASHLSPAANDRKARYERTASAGLQCSPYRPPSTLGRAGSIPRSGDYISQPVGLAPMPYSFDVMPHSTSPSSTTALSSSPSPIVVDTVRSSARSSIRPSSQNVVRKLQKPRPKSQPPPVGSITVQGHRGLELSDIPRVPSVIAARHADRLRQFPLLEHTFPSPQHTTKEEDLSPRAVALVPIRFPSPANALEAATSDLYVASSMSDERKIFRRGALSRNQSSMASDGDEYVDSAIFRSPSWSEFGRGRNKKQKRLAREEKKNQKRLLDEEKVFAKRLERNKKELEKQIRKTGKQSALHSRSASRTRAKSSDHLPSQCDTLVAIADFGTVTESLGGNPYDVTTSMFANALHSAGNKHPHQISSAVSRPKSMVGMGEVVAAEAARARSRTRSQSHERPISSSENSYAKNDGISGGRLRPHSMLVNVVPPVPALAAVDIKAHNLEWARNRRRSQSFSGVRLDGKRPVSGHDGFPEKLDGASGNVVPSPPVPALPSLQQVKQQEAQITSARPQSITVGASSTRALALTHIGEKEVENVDLSNAGHDLLAPPCKTKASRLVPDLWSKGSLEKMTRPVERMRTNCDSNDTSPNEGHLDIDKTRWDVQREAWSQRRKSAGEALLKNRASQDVATRITDSDTPDENWQSSAQSSVITDCTAEPPYVHGPKQQSRPGVSPLAPSRRPPAPPQLYESEFNSSPYSLSRPTIYNELHNDHRSRLSPSQPSNTLTHPNESQFPIPAEGGTQTPDSFTIPRKALSSDISTPHSKLETLTGRYAGGLMYGYEPGCGLGGSAGTRNGTTAATRKSVDVSRGFGIDLSDVPIFVAPTPAK